jgi:hypothetical protein
LDDAGGLTMIISSLISTAAFVLGLFYLRKGDRGVAKQSFGRAEGVTLLSIGIVWGLFLQTSPAALFSLLLLLVVFVVDLWRPRRFFFRDGIATVVVVYAALFVLSLPRLEHNMGLRAQYPYVSLKDRVPKTTAAYPSNSEVAFAKPELLTRWEGELDRQSRRRVSRRRALQTIHSGYLLQFVNSSNFGVSRMPDTAANPRLALDPPMIDPIPQPVAIESAISTTESSAKMNEAPSSTIREANLTSSLPADAHQSSVYGFLHADDFGLVESLERVAGFEPHGFRYRWDAKTWLEQREPYVQRIELVSLLLHDPPAVYQSEHLPRMDLLKDAPTRPLDAFELQSLEKLRSGEEIVADAKDHPTRMLGAIRAARQCLTCHEVPRGTLLGAFSYRLRGDGRPKVEHNEQKKGGEKL